MSLPPVTTTPTDPDPYWSYPQDPWQEEQDYEINSRHDRWEGWGDPDPTPDDYFTEGNDVQGPPPQPNEQQYDPPGPNEIPF